MDVSNSKTGSNVRFDIEMSPTSAAREIFYLSTVYTARKARFFIRVIRSLHYSFALKETCWSAPTDLVPA